MRYWLILLATVITLVVPCLGQLQYQPGDRVEFDSTESGRYWTKGTVLPFQPGDFGGGAEPDGSWYRVKADYNGVQYPCKPQWIRPLGSPKASNNGSSTNTQQQPTSPATNPTTTGLEGRQFVTCPVPQAQVGPGARPDPELFKKLIRCKKGEKAADDGAVTVDVTALQVGSPRPWSYSQDIGNGKVGTLVYPVKATYTVKTHYKTATEVEANWIRILNFYVNSFGEWQIGSEEPVKSPETQRINR